MVNSSLVCMSAYPLGVSRLSAPADFAWHVTLVSALVWIAHVSSPNFTHSVDASPVPVIVITVSGPASVGLKLETTGVKVFKYEKTYHLRITGTSLGQPLQEVWQTVAQFKAGIRQLISVPSELGVSPSRRASVHAGVVVRTLILEQSERKWPSKVTSAPPKCPP